MSTHNVCTARVCTWSRVCSRGAACRGWEWVNTGVYAGAVHTAGVSSGCRGHSRGSVCVCAVAQCVHGRGGVVEPQDPGLERGWGGGPGGEEAGISGRQARGGWGRPGRL